MYQPKFRITPYLLNLIDEAAYHRSWIDHAPLQVAWLPVMQKEARTKSAHYSTSIEGNPLSLAQVSAINRGEKIGAAYNQEQEVKNYLRGINWIDKHSKEELNENNLLHLHKLLTQNLLPNNKSGHFKERQNYIVDEKGIKCFTPPSPQATPELVRELLAWLKVRETKELHSLLVCAICHHRLVSIHPFADGNGRLARALSTLILFQRDFDLRHIFALDEFFSTNRRRYYQKLQQARGLDNDLTYWLEYVAEGVAVTLKKVKERIEGLQVTATYPIQISARQEEALRLLRDYPFLRTQELTSKLNVSRARINQLLTPLIEGGLIKKDGASRATRYHLNLH